MKAEMNIGWRCPVNDAGEGFGFNESGIEHFTGNPFSAIAREITQNTNDATEIRPAFLQFKLIRVKKTEFPNRDEFLEILKHCSSAAKEEGQKAITFFKNALNLIENDTIAFLVARDRNTTGIAGPCEKGTPYHAFMKSTGTSRKNDPTSGGSFGIGKNAPFALSDLHTVFVLTRYKDNSGQIQQLAQGKSILISHTAKKKDYTNNAYWGNKDNFQPLSYCNPGLPNWMTNPFGESESESTTGTTVFVAGFRENAKWDKIITAYIIQNFFSAIRNQQLTIEVGAYVINEKTISDLFLDDEIKKAISDYPDQPTSFEHSRYYFECMDADQTIHETSQQLHLGKTNVGILLGDQFPRKVAFIRNGMLITDNLPGLKRFSGLKPFVSVVECKNKDGNILLKQMEPPRHDAFEPDRLIPTKTKIGRAALRQLSDFVKKHLKQYAGNPIESEVNLDELSDLLGSDATGSDLSKSGEPNPSGRILITKKPKPTTNLNRKQSQSENGLGEGFDNTGKGGDLDESGKEDSTGGQPAGTGTKDGIGVTEEPATYGKKAIVDGKEAKARQKSIALRNVRGVILNEKTRRISFMAPIDGNIRVSFERVGIDSNHPLEINSATIGKITDKKTIDLSVKKLIKSEIEVTFKSNVEGAIKVLANAF